MSIHRAALDDDDDYELWRLRHWHIDGFFFELYGAVDMLLQEINELYELALKIDNVTKKRIEEVIKRQDLRLPVFTYLDRCWDLNSLKIVREFRNTAAHRYPIRIATGNPFPIPTDPSEGFTLDIFLADTSRYVVKPVTSLDQYLRRITVIILRSWTNINNSWPDRYSLGLDITTP